MTNSKTKTIFSCQKCGHQSPRWMGRCPECEGWNSLIEEVFIPEKILKPAGKEADFSPPRRIDEITGVDNIRIATGNAELDRVLGGGLVSGSVVLLGGEPGIGKSTLLLELSHELGLKGKCVLYASGEESAEQIRLRSERLGITKGNFYILTQTNLDRIMEEAQKLKAGFLIVDSIQVVEDPRLTSAAGSVSQIRESAHRLVQLAKHQGLTVIMAGHITKEGSIAGPKLLEHVVDVVLYFETDLRSDLRILRAVKNRFGRSDEVGVLRMADEGIFSVTDPSREFLTPRTAKSSGSVAVPVLEGNRVIMVELQALVKSSNFNLARYRASGADLNRVLLLIAVLERHLGLKLRDQDIFVSVAGGLRVEETALDLGIAASIASSFGNTPIRPDDVVFGELGLTGEVRNVLQPERRITEAAKMGFKRIILPRANLKHLKKKFDIEIVGVSSIEEALKRSLA